MAPTMESACEPRADVLGGRNLWQVYTDHRMSQQEQIGKQEESQVRKEEQEEEQEKQQEGAYATCLALAKAQGFA